MRYPLICPCGEQGWHPLIPLANTNLADNINLHACCCGLQSILRVMTMNRMLQDIGERDQQGYHSFNTTLFSCRIIILYSLLFSTPAVCFRNFMSMPGSMLKLTISILHTLITLNCVLIVPMDYRMQSGQESKKTHSNCIVKLSFLHLSPALLNI